MISPFALTESEEFFLKTTSKDTEEHHSTSYPQLPYEFNPTPRLQNFNYITKPKPNSPITFIKIISIEIFIGNSDFSNSLLGNLKNESYDEECEFNFDTESTVFNEEDKFLKIANKEDPINPYKNYFHSIAYILELTDFEKFLQYHDKFPFLTLRKRILWLKIVLSSICHIIIKSRSFEFFILIIIIWNTIMLCLGDPTQDSSFNMFDPSFLIIYTIEMLLKIFAQGFILKKHSYLRSAWNWIDFTIVLTGYLPYFLEDDGNAINISSLRILRVIRPLRTISFLAELKKIILTILNALPNFLNVMLIFFFFLVFFGISGLQLFSGVLKKRCFQEFTGLILTQTYDTTYQGVLCGFDVCPDSYACGKLISSPNFDVTNFDNIFWSMSQIFITFTLFFNMYYLARTFNYYGAAIFFIFCSVIGSFLLLSMMISVICSAYQAEEAKKLEEMKFSSIKVRKSVMKVLDFIEKRKILKNGRKFKKYKIMIDFTIDYPCNSFEDVLINHALRAQEIKIYNIEQALKAKDNKFTIVHRGKKIREEEDSTEEPKWLKRCKKINGNFNIHDQKAIKTIFYNKKRINLPLFAKLSLRKYNLIEIKQANEQPNYNNKLKKLIYNSVKKKIFFSYEKAVLLINKQIEEPAKKHINSEFNHKEIFHFIKENDLNIKLKLDSCLYKTEKIELGWPAEELSIPKLTIEEKQSKKKKKRIIKRINKIIEVLNSNSYDINIWLPGLKGKVSLIWKYFRKFIYTPAFDNFIMMVVVINTVVMCLDGLVDEEQDKTLKNISKILTYIFIGELAIKVLALGPLKYLSFKSNILDGSIVVTSVIELIFLDTNAFSAFRSIRIIRMFRVLRVVRLLRSFKFMATIIDVLVEKFTSFIYLFLLTFIFFLMYALVGTQLYAGKINKSMGFYQNFDNFYFAFLAIFQSVTFINFNDIQVITLNTDVYRGLTMLFLMSLTIIGNYVFLNLFIGILINGFVDKASSSEEDEEMDTQNDYYDKNKELEDKLKTEKLKLMNNFDEEDIVESFLFTKKKEEKTMFLGIECEESLYIFNKKMRIRQILYKLVISTHFETFILIIIVISSVKLSLDTHDIVGDSSEPIDKTLNLIFVAEAGFKIIAYGFFFDKGSYLRNGWNILDFFIVFISIIDMSLTDLNLSFQKIFRLLRILRPLRFITHNESLKLILSALFNSIGPLLEVMIVILLVFLIFAIFGMSFLQDYFGTCISSISPFNVSKTMCKEIEGTWIVPFTNFDNIIYSLLTIFILSTQANWNIIMYSAMNGNTSDEGPSLNANPYIGVFFVFCIICLSFILINLFIGVLCYHFGAAQNSKNKNTLFITGEQQIWIDLQYYIIKARLEKPKFTEIIKKDSFFTKLVKSKKFDIFIMFCIICNALIMAMSYEGSSQDYQSVLEKFNYAFTGIFILELLLKITILGFVKYSKDGWNKLDSIIVFLSIIDIFFQFVIGATSNKFLRVGPQIIRIFRIVRVVRVLKLIKKLESLKKIIESLILSLPNVFSVAILLLLFYYIYAILGVFLFKDITRGIFFDKYNNFSNFLYSFMTLLGVISGQTWTSIFFDTFHLPPDCIPNETCGSLASPFYFISFIVIGVFIVQNLFVLVLLGSLNQENIGTAKDIFEKVFEEFKEHFLFTLNEQRKEFFHEREYFHKKDVIQFFKTLKGPLGFPKDENNIYYHLEIMQMKIRCDDYDNINFNDLLFSALKRVYAKDLFQNVSTKTIEYISHIENRTKKEIDENIKTRKLSPMHRIINTVEDLFSSVLRKKKIQQSKKKILNTLISTLYCKMTFLAWKRMVSKKTENLIPILLSKETSDKVKLS